jgi:hypothetical protein
VLAATTATAPAGSAAFVAAKAKPRTYKVKLRARDNVSGLAGMQATSNKSKPGKLQRYRTTVRVRSASKRILVRVKDRAGNYSSWRKVAVKRR